MIERFADHAANERTYLAWVRTALAIAGFGVLIDKVATPNDGARWFSPAMIGLGVILLLLATLRFHATRKQLDSPESDRGRFEWSEALLGWMVGLLLSFGLLFFYGLI